MDGQGTDADERLLSAAGLQISVTDHRVVGEATDMQPDRDVHVQEAASPAHIQRVQLGDVVVEEQNTRPAEHPAEDQGHVPLRADVRPPFEHCAGASRREVSQLGSRSGPGPARPRRSGRRPAAGAAPC